MGLLSFVGFFDVSARLPLDLWASLLLCAGLAAQLARLASRRPLAFLRLVRRTVPLLAGALLSIMLGTIGGRALVRASGGGRLASRARRRPERAA